MCDKGFTWDLSNCERECYNSCDVGEYLDNENFRCRNKLVDKLVEECIEKIDGSKMFHNENLDVILLNVFNKVCGFCALLIVLTSICISSVFIYFHWYFKKDNFRVKFNPGTQTTVY